MTPTFNFILLLVLQRFRSMESFEEAIQRAVLELQVNQNPKNAIEQEEFIANLTRQVSIHGITACFSYDHMCPVE